MIKDYQVILIFLVFETIYILVLKHKIEKRVRFEESLYELKKHFDERKLKNE